MHSNLAEHDTDMESWFCSLTIGLLAKIMVKLHHLEEGQKQILQAVRLAGGGSAVDDLDDNILEETINTMEAFDELCDKLTDDTIKRKMVNFLIRTVQPHTV